jgi:hypothetical protein
MMGRRTGRRTSVAAIATAVALGLVVPAAAQFGWIFGDPPRPPSNVPGGRPQQPPQPYPQQPDYPPPPANYPPANYPPDYPPGGQPGVQSRPLPPPSGAALDPAPRAPLPPPPGAAVDPAPRALTPPLGSAPGSAPTNLAPNLGPAPRGPRGQQPADASPQPGDEVITEPPPQRIVNKSALFSGLDKITGRIISFDVAIGETVQFGALQVTPRTCFTRPTTDTQNTDAFIEVEEVTLQGEVRRIFTGWVFAASPGLHAVEHPIYDIWLTDCKNPVVVAEPVAPTPTPAAAPPPRNPPAQPKQKQAPKQQPQQQTQGGFPPFR